MGNNGNKVINSFMWKYAEKTLSQMISIVVSVILARLLQPSDYGIIAIVNIFIIFANYFVSEGFSSALIQKKDTDEIDFYSVSYFNIVVAVVLYILLFCFSPYFAQFFGKGYEVLTPVLRVLGIKLIFIAVNSVQYAYVAKKCAFKLLFVASLFGTLISGITGIIMAYGGYGVWALVFQSLLNAVVNTLTMYILIQKKPQRCFSINRVKALLPFGTKILASGLLSIGFEEIRALVIGKVYQSDQLAFFDRGKQFPNLVVGNVSESIGAVLFPQMAHVQSNRVELKSLMEKSIRIGSFAIFPITMGMFVIADTFVEVILTEKWLPCVTMLRMFCIMYLFYPIHTTNMQAIKALGCGSIYIKLETAKKIIEVVLFVIAINMGVNTVVGVMAFTSVAFTIVNAYPNKELVNFPFKEQVHDIAPAFVNSIIMAMIVAACGFLPIQGMVLLLIQIGVGIASYILIAIVTRNEEFHYILKTVKLLINKKQKENDND